jgi:ABC-type Fe3+-hydroxamate transport system substrate-binding protein
VKNRTGWNDITAVKKDSICTDITPDLLLRSGPRCLDGAEKLADWLAK